MILQDRDLYDYRAIESQVACRPYFRPRSSFVKTDYRHQVSLPQPNIITYNSQVITHVREADSNPIGDRDPDIICFTGAEFGLGYDGRMGIVMNRSKFGQYFDPNGNIVVRENCGKNSPYGKF